MAGAEIVRDGTVRMNSMRLGHGNGNFIGGEADPSPQLDTRRARPGGPLPGSAARLDGGVGHGSPAGPAAKIKSVCKSGTRIAAHESGANHQNVTMLSLRDSAQRHVAGAARVPVLGALTFPPQSLTLYAD